jgi:hypothetical protein
MASHGVNRYRDWDELRYSVRSIEKHATSFRNRVQIVVNDINGTTQPKQIPHWLDNGRAGGQKIEIIAQSELFEAAKQQCLPTFNSLTMENQLFNLESDVDHVGRGPSCCEEGKLTASSSSLSLMTCCSVDHTPQRTYTRLSSAQRWASRVIRTAKCHLPTRPTQRGLERSRS